MYKYIHIDEKTSYDIIIIGGGSSGIAAGVSAAREGKKVALVEESVSLGGMITNGISNTDIGIAPLENISNFPQKRWISNIEISNGLFEEFRQKVFNYYGGINECESGFRYEPKVAKSILDSIISQYTNLNIDLTVKVSEIKLEDNRISKITIEDINKTKKIINLSENGYVIDATDCGDIAYKIGCSFFYGRESKAETNEAFAGKIYWDHYSATHENKYKLLRTSDANTTHEADNKIQAYSYLVTIKDYKSTAPNLIKTAPAGYNPANYDIGTPFEDTWTITCGFMPNLKYEVNVHPKGSDLQEINYNYAEETNRENIEKTYRDHLLGYIYYIQNVLGKKNYGLANDEYTDNQNIPYKLYVRESRRIKGHYIFSEHDACPFVIKEGSDGTLSGTYKNYNGTITYRPPLHSDSIGVVSYAMDSHATQKYNEYKENDPKIRHKGEGEFYISSLTGPGNIPLGIIVPKSNIKNLLVSHAVSATHVGYGTLRMEPTRISLGQAAGVTACVAIDSNINNSNFYDENEKINENLLYKVQTKLVSETHKVMLHFYSDVAKNHWGNEAIQILSLLGIFRGYENYEFRPSQTITRAEFIKICMVARDIVKNDINLQAAYLTYPGFTDVHTDDWFYSYVKNAYELGTVIGYSDNTFRPNDPPTRVDAASILLKSLNFQIKSYDYVPFSDITLDANGNKPWYYDIVGTIDELGIMVGDKPVDSPESTVTTFRPTDSLTRAEAATILYRAIKLIKKL